MLPETCSQVRATNNGARTASNVFTLPGPPLNVYGVLWSLIAKLHVLTLYP